MSNDHIVSEKRFILKKAEISKPFFPKFKARFRFLIKNYS